MRKTKIICTLGPATDEELVLDQLICGGMDVARLNFSHGNHHEQAGRIEMVKKLRKKHNRHVGVMLDTKGPEIRTGNFSNGRVELVAGQDFVLKGSEFDGNEKGVSITYPELYKDVKTGTKILIDDGLIAMTVIKIEGNDIVCRVENGGPVSNHKGINVPDAHLQLPYLSNKDREDILFGITQDIDFVAASFARTAEDVGMIRNLLDENGGKDIKIIAKIENREGVENVSEILEIADGVMVARGDLGVEMPYEKVPSIQKQIIKKANEKGKIVITATQMLDSMMKNPRPTRAESTDVANAIYDGTSAIMLSGETAAGRYPLEALQTMAKIAESTEEDIDYEKRFRVRHSRTNQNVTDAICHATCTTAMDLNARALVTVTKSGTTARMISKYRPSCGIIGGAIDEKVCRQLNLSWGITPVLIEEKRDVFELFRHAIDIAKDDGLLNQGDLVVTTSGIPLGLSGTTNMLKVEVV